MEKEGDSKEIDPLSKLREEISFLNHLVGSLENLEKELEKYHKKKDAGKFNQTKRIILQIQNKIKEGIE